MSYFDIENIWKYLTSSFNSFSILLCLKTIDCSNTVLRHSNETSLIIIICIIQIMTSLMELIAMLYVIIKIHFPVAEKCTMVPFLTNILTINHFFPSVKISILLCLLILFCQNAKDVHA